MTEPFTDVPAAGETARADQPELTVIVPRRPGPLVRHKGNESADDELDALIDEMFGETTTEQPGRLDVVLILAGAALLAWAWLTAAAVGVFVIAVLLLVLGLALPTRAALRAYHRRRLVKERRAELDDGYRLDVSDPSVAELVAAYESVLEIAARTRSDLAEPSVVASHLAVVEAAAMLDGRPPIAEADRRYVDTRTAAMTKVAHGLSLAPRRSTADDRGYDSTAVARTATVTVRQDLESATDLGAMRRLERLGARLEPVASPADRTSEATGDPER